MAYKNLPLADIVANDPKYELIDDQRSRRGYVLVRCPNHDGVTEHVVFVHNPLPKPRLGGPGLPAHAYCLNDDCKHMTTEMLLGLELD
jgi:hypothetical protein